jgi:hypothetical protein
MENMVSAMGVDATCCGYQIMIEYVSIEFGPTKVQQDDMSGQGFISTNILCISVYRSHETKVVVRTRGVEYQWVKPQRTSQVRPRLRRLWGTEVKRVGIPHCPVALGDRDGARLRGARSDHLSVIHATHFRQGKQ